MIVRAFKNMAIRHKLMLIMMLTCLAALIMACTAILVWEWKNFKTQRIDYLTSHARIIAENSEAALTFEDQMDAEVTLQALGSEESIVFACIYDKHDELFAEFVRNKNEVRLVRQSMWETGSYVESGNLIVVEPVVLDEEEIGTIVLAADMKPMWDTLKRNIIIVVYIILITVLFAYLISSRVQRVISKPIVDLTQVAQNISENKEYSSRAVKHSDDELGVLIDSFNEMLEQIQQRDSALVQSKEELEQKVKARTEELSNNNVKLAEEIAERSVTERKLQRNIRQLGCLFGIFKLVEQADIPLQSVFEATVDHIQKAYQDPELINVRIVFKDSKFETYNFIETDLHQEALLRVRGQVHGKISVYYSGEPLPDGRNPFLREERDLLDAVSEQLGSVISRRMVEDALRAGEERFRTLVSNIPGIVYRGANDAERTMEFVSAELSAISGYPADDFINNEKRTYTSLIHPDDRKHVREVLDEAIEQKRPYICEYRMITARGETKWVYEKGQAIFENGRVVCLDGAIFDITDRKEAEGKQEELMAELENANQELKDFAYIVSHDLKAPLRGIKTLAEWIVSDYQDKLDDDAKEQFDLLLTRVQRMHNLIDGILQYSRVGRVKEELLPVDLAQLLPEVIDMLNPPENMDVKVVSDLPTIKCEPTRIQQVFQNLISNALKYIDKPQGIVEVGCEEEGEFWKFYVKDNGPGIEEKYFDKVFKIFQTLTPKDSYESTGVGLSVVKKAIESYGGRIWVESVVGEGCTFLFTFPQKESEAQNDEKREANTTC